MTRIFAMCVGFILVLAASQVVLARYLVPGEPRVELLDTYLRDGYDIIYFGDSVIDTHTSKDSDPSSIVDMLRKREAGLTIADFSRGADNLDLFELYVAYIARSPVKPSAVIVPINLRSFSPGWDLDPTGQFEKIKFYLTAQPRFLTYFYRPFAISGVINMNEVSEAVFQDTSVYYGKGVVGKVAQYEGRRWLSEPAAEDVRDMYIYSYMPSLDSDHRKLESLRRLVDTAKENDIEVYAYITPVDYEGGGRYVGEDFVEQIKENAAVVCAVLKEKSVLCLNLALNLTSEHFSHPEYPDEHLRQSGRAFVSKSVDEFFFKKSPNDSD